MLHPSFARAERPLIRLSTAREIPRRSHFGVRANRSLRLINHDEATRRLLVRGKHEAAMRCLLAALGLIGLLTPAVAADYELPTLRGSQMFIPAAPAYFSCERPYAGCPDGATGTG